MKSGTLLAVAVTVFVGLIATAIVEAHTDGEIVNSHAFYPEGPLWAGGLLYYAEMSADRVLRWDGKANQVFWRRKNCGPTSIAPFGQDGFVILCHFENALVQVDGTGQTLAVFRRDVDHKRFKNPNDSIPDGSGGVYFSASGVFDRRRPATGAIYRLTPDGQIHKLVAGLRYSNGVAMSANRTRLFVSEHLARRVLEYSVSSDGALNFLSVYVDLDDIAPPSGSSYALAGPDGLEVDAAGNLYVCEYGAARVVIINDKRELAAIVSYSQRYLTNIALDEDAAWMTLTGASDNRKPPFPGRVERMRNPVTIRPGLVGK